MQNRGGYSLMLKRLFKNKKGSELVEKILMVAFSVAAGAAVIVYLVSVINNKKTTSVDIPTA